MQIANLQPTFLPWLGWFDIVDQVDLLVILDDVPFAERSWQQRNRLYTQKGLEYATVPVCTAGRRGQLILEVEIAEPRFVEKLERTISYNYARAPHYQALFPGFREALHDSAAGGRLSGLNVGLIEWFLAALDVKTPWCLSRTLATAGKRGEYMAALCETVGASDYLSPVGAEEYLLEDRAAFDSRGLNVWLHEYQHPEYSQVFQPFMPYASTLDLLFNEGPRALEIIRSGRRPPRSLGVPAGQNL